MMDNLFWNGSSSLSVALTIVTFTLGPYCSACPSCISILCSLSILMPCIQMCMLFLLLLSACLLALSSQLILILPGSAHMSIYSKAINGMLFQSIPKKSQANLLYTVHCHFFCVFFFPFQYIKNAKREMGQVTIVLEPRKMSDIH